MLVSFVPKAKNLKELILEHEKKKKKLQDNVTNYSKVDSSQVGVTRFEPIIEGLCIVSWISFTIGSHTKYYHGIFNLS